MEEKKALKKWTKEEDDRLLRQVKAFPHNLHKCFIVVAEEIGRTPTAVSAHWYSVLSKNPDVLAFFTASSKHVARNRKNGMGEEIDNSIWRKFVRILKSIFNKNK